MQKYLLITGHLARGALAKIVAGIKEEEQNLKLAIKELPCTVAALMSTDFIAAKLKRDQSIDVTEIIIIPGLCTGDVEEISMVTGCQVYKGPKDLKNLPGFFQNGEIKEPEIIDYGSSPIKILGEIVDAHQLNLNEIMQRADYYRQQGADIIDLGGSIHQPFPHLAQVVKTLKGDGFKVSMDSHLKEDILTASRAGVDLILSLTSHNIHLAQALNCPAVLIPDDGEDLNTLYHNMELMEKWRLPYLADPILPPLTLGVAAGLGRYLKVRQDFPEVPMLMGLGNVTELIDADSIGINALLVGIAAELGINYLLTTEVAHRARGSVQEISWARDLMHRAILQERVPKHIRDELLTIKDGEGNTYAKAELQEMQELIKDRNFRIFVADQIYIFNGQCFYGGTSARELFVRLDIKDSSHSFYLGQELNKAELALQLGKKYVQDSPLDWGYFNQGELK